MRTPDSAMRPANGRRFGLSLQVLLAFGTVVALLAAVAAIAVIQLRGQGSNDQQAMEHSSDSDTKAAEVLAALNAVRFQQMEMRSSSGDELVADWATEQELFTAFESKLDEFSQFFTSTYGADMQWGTEEQQAWQDYKDAITSAYDPTYTGTEVDRSTRAELADTMLGHVGDLTDQVDDQIAINSADAASQVTKVTYMLVGIAVVAVGVAVALGVWFARRITGAAGKVERSLEAMGEGDLTVEADVTSNDELGDMARSLRKAQGALRETMAEVIDSAQTVAA
ncbi:HAMP domain-containing protein, partial [Demequina salsinemoris]|uniref:HAMP domain-containing protein n=1 Tax=Demequina salsinemoris TaxID=577470 RepID=UPI001364C671